MTTSMSAITTALGSVVTSVTGMIGGWLDVITEQPVLLFFLVLPLVGIGVGFIKRLISVR